MTLKLFISKIVTSSPFGLYTKYIFWKSYSINYILSIYIFNWFLHYCQIGLNWKKGKFSHILLCKLFTLFLTRMPNAWFSIKSLDSFNQIEDLTIIFLKLEWMRLIKLIVYVVYIFLKNVENIFSFNNCNKRKIKKMFLNSRN